MGDSKSLLEVDNLVCGYGVAEIIKGISFSVRDGDFLGVIGPNGAGKTTLLRAITGVVKRLKGIILYNGVDINSLSRNELAKEIAVLPQMLEAPFSFSVEEFVTMGRFPHTKRFEKIKGRSLEIVGEAMELTDVRDLRKRRVGELSGGERQRVILAQCLAQQPRLMLLDEPTAHLDIGHQIYILDLMRRMKKKKAITIIMVMHDLNLASSYCGELMLLNNGVVFKYGQPEEVLTFQNIEALYRTAVVVKENPITSKPHIYLVPEDKRNS